MRNPPPPIWKPTLQDGVLVDVSDLGIAALLIEASHLVHNAVSTASVAQRALDGDPHAIHAIRAHDTRLDRDRTILGFRLSAASRYMKGRETDASDIKVAEEDVTQETTLTGEPT